MGKIMLRKINLSPCPQANLSNIIPVIIKGKYSVVLFCTKTVQPILRFFYPSVILDNDDKKILK